VAWKVFSSLAKRYRDRVQPLSLRFPLEEQPGDLAAFIRPCEVFTTTWAEK